MIISSFTVQSIADENDNKRESLPYYKSAIPIFFFRSTVSWKINSFSRSLGRSSNSISNVNGSSATGCELK